MGKKTVVRVSDELAKMMADADVAARKWRRIRDNAEKYLEEACRLESEFWDNAGHKSRDFKAKDGEDKTLYYCSASKCVYYNTDDDTDDRWDEPENLKIVKLHAINAGGVDE